MPRAFTQSEFDALMDDESKSVIGDIDWSEDDDHSPAVEFRMRVENDQGHPLFVRGSFNVFASALSFVLVHQAAGRIYALDLGKEHRNPDGSLVGEKHKHRFTEQFRDKWAYVPTDITQPATDPVGVWKEFCAEA